MSQAPNPYNNNSGLHQPNTGNFPQFTQIPSSQLPGSIKQDGNPNSAVTMANQINHFNQSANSSPAFNQSGMMPPPTSLQSSPMRPTKPPINPSFTPVQNTQNIPQSLASSSVSNTPSYYPPNMAQRQINNNAPPLIPSSQYSQPLVNGPPSYSTGPNKLSNQYPAPSSSFSPIPMNQPAVQAPYGPINPLSVNQRPPIGPMSNQPPLTQNTLPTSGARNSPLIAGPPNIPPMTSTSYIGSGPQGLSSGPMVNQPSMPHNPSSLSGPRNSPVAPGPPSNPPISSTSHTVPSQQGLPSAPMVNQPPLPHNALSISGSRNSPIVPGPPGLPPTSRAPYTGPGAQGGPPRNLMNGPLAPISQMEPPRSIPSGPPTMGTLPQQSQNQQNNGPSTQQGNNYPLSGPQSIPNMPSGPNMMPQQPMPQVPQGPPRSNMQNRYPQMPQSNFPPQMPMPQNNMPMPQNNLTPQQQMQMQQNIAKQFPASKMHGLNQQMGQLSVTKQGFDQLWGHQSVDLLQCRNVLPEYPEDPPEIRLGHQFAESPNCSHEIFRSTINRIPETNSLLQKSRLPLGILIHPFKDLNHLPVIQCTTIVRCRACRTYINPFVYFVDSKRWKCNLCYRVNDLPEEFQYDPVSKSYGDPSRRPEIKSATIEFIAPSEYMLRPPQPAVYLFLLDVSHIARDSGYLQVVCDTLKENLDQLPGDARMQIGFICYDEHIHYYLMSEGLTRPKEMTILDIDDVFLPSPESLLVNVGENREMVGELLALLPRRYSAPGVPASALGAALQAAYKLMAPTGGRVTVFQTCLPNIGPGALQSREDPNARSSKEVSHLNPATDFYKRLALDCSGAQVAVDLFLLSAQYCDLATLSGMSKFSAGTVHHIPLFRAQRPWQAEQLKNMFTRYLTRKIGFEAVMRVRCTRGIAIHTFHGNFFVRSTDLLSLPNVSPDAGFGMQLTIEESLADLQQVCFQAALLYTSSKGERRIRVHTLALPIANTLPEVLHAADQQCIIGLLSKMAVDRCVSASMSEAKEALINVAVDVLSAHRLAQNLPAGALNTALQAPVSLRLLPLYILALLKRKAFRTGTSTRLDERVMDMCLMKSAPLGQLLRAVYPDLYAVHRLEEYARDSLEAPDLPRMHLSAERINSNGAYLLDDGETMLVYVCHGVSAAYLSETFGVAAFSQLPDEARALPDLETDGNELLRAFVDKLNDDRPVPSSILILRDNSPSRLLFTERLVDDRVESAFSYYEFLQHVKSQVK